eukprot:3207524-Amphidinium_carterae.1
MSSCVCDHGGCSRFARKIYTKGLPQLKQKVDERGLQMVCKFQRRRSSWKSTIIKSPRGRVEKLRRLLARLV